MQKEKEAIHQDDHHPAELVEQSLGTVKFTKTIIKRTVKFTKKKTFLVIYEIES